MLHLLRFVRRGAVCLIGLITVWCLGCSGYEPLLSSLLGRSHASMTCGLEMRSAADASAPITVSAADDAGQGLDCGCQSCHAASPLVAIVDALDPGIATTDVPFPDAPASVVRTPLLPPPQAGLAGSSVPMSDVAG